MTNTTGQTAQTEAATQIIELVGPALDRARGDSTPHADRERDARQRLALVRRRDQRSWYEPRHASPEAPKCSVEQPDKPTNPSLIACCLREGHDGDHWSSSGCAGSDMWWPNGGAS